MVPQISHKNVVVLVNKLDEVNWSEEAFADSIRATNAALKDLEVSEEQYYAHLLFLK
ncbi:hypothetical protein HBH73_255940, partial [Parastagonospora nodorum]